MLVRSKLAQTAREALGSTADGAIILVGGFGDRGIPFALLDGLLETGARHLTLVSINAGRGDLGVSRLIAAGRIDRIVCSFPRTAGSVAFEAAYAAGHIGLELVPMGTLVARLQAGASGTAAFYTPVAAGTALADGKEVRDFGGRPHLLEHALRGDVGLVRAERADAYGNLSFRGTDRNLNPLAARASNRAVAEVERMSDAPINPEHVEVPGLYIGQVLIAPERGRRAAA
jgi:3-oxoadipate CoA-transferase alpha subunit